MIATTATDSDTQILVASKNVDDAKLVAELLGEDFSQVGTSFDAEHAVSDFESYQPQVLVLAFKALEELERFYLGLHRLSAQVHAIGHRTLILCQRSDSYRAYELCRKQHFDDYVVFWPASHDPQRLRMAVLLAARAGSMIGRNGPSTMAFATQARRIVELESLLQRSVARGSERIAQLSESLRQAEANVGEVLESFSQRVVSGSHGDLVEIKNRAAFEREFNRLCDVEVKRPFEAVNALLAPVSQWLDTFNDELAPHLESARVLADLADRVRPLILVVDDDEFQHRLLQRMLDEAAVELIFAGSGTEALALLRTHRPDLILMDFHLPNVSGVEVMRRLKLAPATAEIPVILITGTSTKEVLVESHKAGAVDFMVKPFDKRRLVEGINRHLHGRTTP